MDRRPPERGCRQRRRARETRSSRALPHGITIWNRIETSIGPLRLVSAWLACASASCEVVRAGGVERSRALHIAAEMGVAEVEAVGAR